MGDEVEPLKDSVDLRGHALLPLVPTWPKIKSGRYDRLGHVQHACHLNRRRDVVDCHVKRNRSHIAVAVGCRDRHGLRVVRPIRRVEAPTPRSIAIVGDITHRRSQRNRVAIGIGEDTFIGGRLAFIG